MRLIAMPFTDEELSLASELLEDGDAKRAVVLFRVGARAGDDIAQLMLGYCFDNGLGVRASKSRALFWYRKAAGAGSGAAASNIATILRNAGDRAGALRWFRRAVVLRLDDALLEIAKLQRGAIALATLRRLLRAKILAPVVREEGQTLFDELRADRGRARRSSRRATSR